MYNLTEAGRRKNITMFQVPEYFTSISQRLSEVLAGIGVNEKMVLKRRRSRLLAESLDSIVQTCGVMDHDVSGYYVGSQIEGTTTLGLKSDDDMLYSINCINIIQDWTEWDPDLVNLMMVRDHTTSPGYCYLQRLRNDVQFPSNEVPNNGYIRDSEGRVMMKNTCMEEFVGVLGQNSECHGPSYFIKGPTGYTGSTADLVFALPCKSPPLYALNWFRKQKTRFWDDRARCFVVAVASKVSDNEELEWRISTAVAERYMTFSLNITQIRCYILMKMILKTYKSICNNTLTSYICKTVLFHCINTTGSSFWLDHNLLKCFQYYLIVLQNYLLSNNCPHLLLRKNNLMAGRFLPQNKHMLLQILIHQMQSEGGALREIEIDDLNRHIVVNFSSIGNQDHLRSYSKISTELHGVLTATTATFGTMYRQMISSKALRLLSDILGLSARIPNRLLIYFAIYRRLTQIPALFIQISELILRMFLGRMWTFCEPRSEIYQTAFHLICPFICTTIGSITASWNIELYKAVTQEALNWLKQGLNSDTSSSRLKLASLLYCLEDMDGCELVLKITEDLFVTDYIQCICNCWMHEPLEIKVEYNDFCYNEHETIISYATSFCVCFLPLEINCVPKELQYEMFRLTTGDMPYVDLFDQWMGMAVVDSLPFLYFLKYKVYYTLQKQSDKERALSELAKTINDSVLWHRETAYNLLGQCMELENRPVDALDCYLKSLNIRGRKNVANIHICRLLASIINT
ncbi:uncharacterized protein LOC123558408 [Mercenaria mercenaria]|uniref:uncharacterized protein LOC123558408 n=1 Tax=Mercenaria mercenaria TaxID=6596 RepID=UPI00234F3F67|nr:uncharacterized protein LOC123558408 [Mercenaria mercenaria]